MTTDNKTPEMVPLAFDQKPQAFADIIKAQLTQRAGMAAQSVHDGIAKELFAEKN